ncbi:PREDICTED: ubiquitin carboxyl-terminal hydrolase 14-like [Amphimedon queenslandica]|uniref:Ubiquitin carboxyl-terminal hydrolase n=2 Tax=Amphimedon queenslandica TaxID=400682 RepID=A0AAN0JA68_AMPQE|nr:PREDICTED: ubiquitin carboxyl-terminal hydrolase 14-like [Amphimedon queenslandica]|eukprot:XP_019853603.1 PREDICTED: ubiquitin carboxyl-terminal hydrolase 14-like [Amphimedon queenslandica]
MPTFAVKVKWGKVKYDDLELNTDEPPVIFKSQLFSLTGVPLERQRLMIAGQSIGDDTWTDPVIKKIKPNCMFMLMGSADALPTAPKEKTIFIEDMTEADAARLLEVPFGLHNLGNTCYMNASLQCIRAIPELRREILDFTGHHGLVEGLDVASHELTARMNELFVSMEKREPQLELALFLQGLQTVVPHFATKDESSGVFQQQDAHECWQKLLSILKITLKATDGGDGSSIDKLNYSLLYIVDVKLQHSYKCLESEDEMETMEFEDSLQLSCFIEQEVKYLHTGITKGLKGTIEKASPTLSRNASYQKVSAVTRLPAYLTIQFVRFFHGRSGASEDLVSKKILKDVKFQLHFDAFDFCSPELKEKMLPIRRKYKEVEDRKMAIQAKRITEGVIGKDSSKEASHVLYEPYSFREDPGSNNSGYYELIAVLTHRGRSSSSGHYVAWVRKQPGQWFKYDDDDVTMVTDEEIKKLSGGGDWHMAYILVYGPRPLEIVKEQQ